LPTICRVTLKRVATAVFVAPVAHACTMRARCTTAWAGYCDVVARRAA